MTATAHMQRTWENAPGLVGQLTAVNHGTIGLRFVFTGFAFLLIGGLLAMFMRLQLAWPGNTVLDHDLYNQFVTMHGTTLMFLFAVPVTEGVAMYLIPKMIGARDVPFPRLGVFGYWCYLFGGIFLYASFFVGEAPSGGWFMYPPLTGKEFTPGLSADFWLLGVTFAEIAAVAAAVELIVSILKTRAPGMAIQRMPLFAWYILATAFMIAFGFPPLILASVLLELERAFGFVFYNPDLGGDPLLWQHLFWLFGHSDVYIIFLPAVGVVSTLIPTFARRPIVGYIWIVLAVIGTAFLSFGLWAHHMYTVGIPLLAVGKVSEKEKGPRAPLANPLHVLKRNIEPSTALLMLSCETFISHCATMVEIRGAKSVSIIKGGMHSPLSIKGRIMMKWTISIGLVLAVAFASGSVLAQTPSDNETNRTNGWAHVNEVEVGIGSVILEFVQPRSFFACFEYRRDGDISEQTGPVNFNPAIADGLYPFYCLNNETQIETFFATEYVEVRMVFGAETDERFDWTTFYVAQDVAAKIDCMDGQWEYYGFKNQGQCIRYIETGKDSR